MGRIVILTGAGISAESGLGTFRDEGGLWARHRIEDVATPEGFARDPALVHRFYNIRRAQAAAARAARKRAVGTVAAYDSSLCAPPRARPATPACPAHRVTPLHCIAPPTLQRGGRTRCTARDGRT